jgi:hypothetical protein
MRAQIRRSDQRRWKSKGKRHACRFYPTHAERGHGLCSGHIVFVVCHRDIERRALAALSSAAVPWILHAGQVGKCGIRGRGRTRAKIVEEIKPGGTQPLSP